LGPRRFVRTDTTATIHTLALRTGITGLTGSLAAYLSVLVPGITDTMGRAVSMAVRVMAIGLDMRIGRVTVITRLLPADSSAAGIPRRVSTVVPASASTAVVSMVAAVSIGNLLQGAEAKCLGTLDFFDVLRISLTGRFSSGTIGNPSHSFTR
jgi:hypothetical protein